MSFDMVLVMNMPFRPKDISKSPKYGVMLVHVLPGVSAQQNLMMLNHISDLKFVVLNGYGRGTGSTEDRQLVEELTSQGVYVFRTSPFANGCTDTAYEAGLALEEAGAIGLGKMRAEDAVLFLQKQIALGNHNAQDIADSLMRKVAQLERGQPGFKHDQGMT